MQNQIREVESTTDVNNKKMTRMDRKEKFTGKVIIVFKDDDQMTGIID